MTTGYPAYVKPYIKRQKNDAADAEAICEAVSRANMRFVATVRPGCPQRPSAPSGELWLHEIKHDGFPGHRPQPNRLVATSPISSRPPHI